MRIVFCLPGERFSLNYFNCWNNTVATLGTKGIDVRYSAAYNANVAATRNVILMGNNRRGGDQVPFDGKIEYDWLFWVDDDAVWSPEQVLALVEHDKDIVSGCTVLSDNKTYNVCKSMKDEDLIKNGTFDMLDRERLQQEEGLFEADYVGFAFLAVKKGVFEKMEYPWFEIPTRTIGPITDMTSEDCWWCIKAREKGFKIWVDPKVVVGHEKSVVLR
jgi:GT2 family glycosyltransferase